MTTGLRTAPPLEGLIRISPGAPVLPANTLRFYIHFPRPAEADFDRDRLRLLDAAGQEVAEPFLVLSQELWSADARRLTVLMEPGRIKRGMGAGRLHEPALVAGRSYRLVLAAIGQTCRHDFRVGDPMLSALDETLWHVTPPTRGCLDPVQLRFDRVMDAALCEDGIILVDASERLVETWVTLGADGSSAWLFPCQPWAEGEHRIVFPSSLEDVCGNRLGEALDHDVGKASQPRHGFLGFSL